MNPRESFFKSLPIHLVSLHDLVWPSHDISPEHLSEPERRRPIDDEPIAVERLITGDYFVHDGRHRALRALSRGEHQIKAYTYTTKERA